MTGSAGFDLSAMAARVYEDAVVDVVGPDSLASAPCIVKVSPKIVTHMQPSSEA